MVREVSQAGVSALEDLRRRLVAWRRTKRKGRRIPQELWATAAELSKELGVNRVARALGLSYESLKRRAAVQVGSEAHGVANAAGPAFVELAVGSVARVPECVIEVQGPRRKLTIRLAGHSPEGVATVAEAVWRTAR